ncbi:IS630 family transposase, partial [Klebsiella pneumoniae]|nr:IS630 family transposase [Klebsiella pneumoniae]
SEASVRRIRKRHGLKPHLRRTFKLSNDPLFAEKVEDIAGLYLNPPEHALVLSVDEKSQVQALDRTQPGLPLKKGRSGTMTHDYKRNGT